MARRFVSFTLAGNRYGVPVSEVAQIIRHEHVQPAPSALPMIEGVVNLRGEVVPVLDPRARPDDHSSRRAPLGADRGSAVARGGLSARDRRRIVVVRLAGRTCGIAVDEVHEIVDVEESGITPAAAVEASSGPDAVESPLRITAQVRVGSMVMYLPDLTALLDPSLALLDPARVRPEPEG